MGTPFITGEYIQHKRDLRDYTVERDGEAVTWRRQTGTRGTGRYEENIPPTHESTGTTVKLHLLDYTGFMALLFTALPGDEVEDIWALCETDRAVEEDDLIVFTMPHDRGTTENFVFTVERVQTKKQYGVVIERRVQLARFID